ncbi:hypothetical protein DL769_004910 [Monosporascus sp. CRB-8-3]|nr:hypothetical protein DL769_004910 [Monosporascus sp. CRB-8-3]
MRLCKPLPQSSARLCRPYRFSHRTYRHYATGQSQDVAQPRGPSAAATKEPKNEEEPFNVDPVNKKIETAVGDLPLSPVMDPSFWEARQRYQTPKAKPGKAQNSVERQFRRLPKFFLQDFNLIQHPETGAPWWVPRSLMRHESHVVERLDEEGISEAIQKETEAAAGAEKDTTPTPESEEGDDASIVADTDSGKGGRPYGPSAYALARKDLFAAFKTEGSGFMNSHKRLFGGSSSRYRIFGSRAVWREDMDTYILDLMQREVVDHLLYLARLCAEQGRYYVVRCYGWDDVQHKHKGALLWFQSETQGGTPPGPFATLDTHTRNLHGENNPVTVAVHNMPMLLGDEQAARLKSEARVFGEGSIFMLAGRRTTDLQANLWRLQGLMRDPEHSRDGASPILGYDPEDGTCLVPAIVPDLELGIGREDQSISLDVRREMVKEWETRKTKGYRVVFLDNLKPLRDLSEPSFEKFQCYPQQIVANDFGYQSDFRYYRPCSFAMYGMESEPVEPKEKWIIAVRLWILQHISFGGYRCHGQAFA